MAPYVLAIDQGTTSSRAILFRRDVSIAAVGQQEFPQHFPAPGWVEHDPEDLWTTTVATCRAALEQIGAAARDVAAIGITNQRETTLLWDRRTGAPLHRAIVWQDRRTADLCMRLKADGHEPAVTAKTGLILDPYFSGTKLAWLLDNVPGARERAQRGELAFGTVDSYLLWRLTGGAVHATDATNAARTLLFDIQLGGRRTYALEGSIFVAGAALQWLRDGLGLIRAASESGTLAEAADPSQEVYLVPAFVGLGAPYWDPDARGAIFGLTRGTGPKELARAALESVCFQTADLVAAMQAHS